MLTPSPTILQHRRLRTFPAPHDHSEQVVRVLLADAGDRELSDAYPNESQRQVLKDLARSLRLRFSSRELAYLASTVEVEANTRRAEEDGRVGSAEDLR